MDQPERKNKIEELGDKEEFPVSRRRRFRFWIQFPNTGLINMADKGINKKTMRIFVRIWINLIGMPCYLSSRQLICSDK